MRASGREPSAENVDNTQRGILPNTEGPTAFGKYQLFATLGRGGMADVFLSVARGPMGFNKLAVVKRLRTPLAEEQTFLEMFLDEARLAARLNHPNVVHTYEVGEHNGQYFIAMEYLEGQSLNKVIRELTKAGEELDPGMCARIVADALAGLHHAHELKDYDGTPLRIIHRDVSPHNVFVTYDGLVKLVDFGIAKAALSQTQTEVGVLKGKVAYMAPEQAMGVALDRRADIFAMGIVLWELLARQRLMVGDSAAATLHRLLNRPVPRVSEVVPTIDPKLDALVAKALEKEPDARFQTAQEMREALEAWIVQTGSLVRQDEIGARISGLFASMRADVKRQIQTHMAAVDRAGSSGELAALNEKALRKDGAPLRSSGSLPAIGTGSGSGSGVVKLPAGGVDEAIAGAALPAKKSGALPVLVVVVVAVAVACAVVVSRCVGKSKDIASQSASAPISADDLPPKSTTTRVADTASAAPTPTADSPVPADTASSTPPKKKPAWMLVDAGLPVAPTSTNTAPPTSTATSTQTAEPDSTGPGFLTLDTVPWTHVSEGGRSIGTTPILGVPLSPGAHTLFLENAGEGIHSSLNVNIKSGERTGRRIVLKQPQ